MDVDHSMRVMTEESFGPVVGIARVTSDDEAVARMNDSRFGLTASVWTQDEAAGLALGARVETGTFFVNRCDYLDPTDRRSTELLSSVNTRQPASSSSAATMIFFISVLLDPLLSQNEAFHVLVEDAGHR